MDHAPPTRCDLRIGASGFDYPEWEGAFYRRGLGRTEYLGAYSESFGTLELCLSGRGPSRGGPAREDARGPLAGALAGARRPLDVAVRLGGALTRGAFPVGWKAESLALARALEPLAESGRLVAALACFPVGFRYGEPERRYLDALLRDLAAFPLAVEFLDAEWLNARVIEGLKARGVCLCASDLPRLEGLPPPSDLVTASLAYVRLHGRDPERWLSGSHAGQGYRYAPAELAGWLPRLESMALAARALRVVFCDRRGGCAPLDALALSRLAERAGLL